MILNNRAFTLIELLVVVLIIGILAAIALPQYTKAVEKSRAAEGVTLIKSFGEAEKIYHMETDKSVTSIADIDNLVLGFSKLEASVADTARCKKFGSKNFEICVNNNVVWFERVSNDTRMGYYISMYHQDSAASGGGREIGVPYCCGRNTFGANVCKSIGSKEELDIGYKCGRI
ncbi:prepilin-type N-terminal cleavage/methylation domain-containing protein [Elusimicrobium posterum]|uniref:type IV pilin protein n=1 Tax=Elusimicrobium posterum TaxID=3116653 RepID=UPI003C737746